MLVTETPLLKLNRPFPSGWPWGAQTGSTNGRFYFGVQHSETAKVPTSDGGQIQIAERVMPSRHPPFTVIPTIDIVLTDCSHCGAKAHVIRRSPDPGNPKGRDTHIHVQRLWQANRNRCSRRHRLPAVSGRWQILRRGGWAALSLLTASQRSDGVNCSLSANGGARPRSKRTKTFRYCFCWGFMMARHFQVWRRRRERLVF